MRPGRHTHADMPAGFAALLVVLAMAVGSPPAQGQIHGACCGKHVKLSDEGFGFARDWDCGKELPEAPTKLRAEVCRQLREAGAVCPAVMGACDCEAMREEIESLRGRNRGLAEAAKAHRRALREADGRRWEALDGIYGSRGSAAKFIESTMKSLPWTSKTGGDAAKWARRAGGLIFEGDPHLDEIAKELPKNWVEDKVKDAATRQASRRAAEQATEYYRRTGDASGATDQYLRRSRGFKNAVKGVDAISNLKDLYENGNSLAEVINDWIEAKRDHRNIQEELDRIDQEIVDNVDKIGALQEACAEQDDPGPPVGRASPSPRGPLPASATFCPPPRRPASDGSGAVRFAEAIRWPASVTERPVGSIRPELRARVQEAEPMAAVTAGSPPEPTMEAALRALTRLRSLGHEIPILEERLADGLHALGPFLVGGRELLPPEVLGELLERATTALDSAMAAHERVKAWSLGVAADLDLDPTDGPEPSGATQTAGPDANDLDAAYEALWSSGWTERPDDPAVVGSVGPGARAAVPALFAGLADPTASDGTRETARMLLRAVSRELGTGARVKLGDGFRAPRQWWITAAGAEPEAHLVSGYSTLGSVQELPPGRYDLYWAAQSTQRERPVRIVSDLEVPDSGTVELAITTGIRLELPDWARLDGLHGWWGVALAGRPASEILTYRREVAPLVVPPGRYDVYLVQRYERPPLALARGIEVNTGEMVTVPLLTGLRLQVGEDVRMDPLHGWWGVAPAGAGPDSLVMWESDRLDKAALLPRETYDVYWKREYGHEPELKAAGIEVRDTLVVVDWESGRPVGAGSGGAAPLVALGATVLVALGLGLLRRRRRARA